MFITSFYHFLLYSSLLLIFFTILFLSSYSSLSYFSFSFSPTSCFSYSYSKTLFFLLLLFTNFCKVLSPKPVFSLSPSTPLYTPLFHPVTSPFSSSLTFSYSPPLSARLRLPLYHLLSFTNLFCSSSSPLPSFNFPPLPIIFSLAPHNFLFTLHLFYTLAFLQSASSFVYLLHPDARPFSLSYASLYLPPSFCDLPNFLSLHFPIYFHLFSLLCLHLF